MPIRPYLSTPDTPVNVQVDPHDHIPRGMIMSLREIGDCLGVGVTQNSGDHDLLQLSQLARLAQLTAPGIMRIVEVGSWCGESMLAIVRGLEKYDDTVTLIDCVDTWQGSPTDNSSVAANIYGGDILPFWELAAAQAMMNDDGLTVTGHTLPSREGCHLFDDASLDFVYLDAGHDYISIQEDLQCWYPKVRVGGVFAGHDYSDSFPGVRLAVDAFCQQLGRAPLVPIGSHIWVLIKPPPADGSPS